MSKTKTTIHYEVEFQLSDGWHPSSVTFTHLKHAQKYRADRERYFGFEGRIIKKTETVTTETVVQTKTTVTREMVK